MLRALVVLLVVLPCAPLLPSCRRRCGLLTAPLLPLLLLLLCRWAERLRRGLRARWRHRWRAAGMRLPLQTGAPITMTSTGRRPGSAPWTRCICVRRLGCQARLQLEAHRLVLLRALVKLLGLPQTESPSSLALRLLPAFPARGVEVPHL